MDEKTKKEVKEEKREARSSRQNAGNAIRGLASHGDLYTASIRRGGFWR